MTHDHDYILGALLTGERVPMLAADRRRHMAVFGQTGTGKTAFMLNLMKADLIGGAGFCFLDPHGDASKEIAGLVPPARAAQTIYLDPSDEAYSFSYNPLANIPAAERATAAANIVSAFKNIWADSWGPRLEFILSNALRLLLDAKDQTLLGIPLLFANEEFRNHLARRSRDPLVKFYWLNEFAAFDQRQRNEMISPIQNKIGILLANPFIRSILCQNSSTLEIDSIMNEGKVLIVNLSKGSLGTEPAHLLGALLISAFAQGAERRRNISETMRRDFTLYCDEFQNFATQSFATILSEARKWRLGLVAVSQHVSQLPEPLQQAVFGNVGTLVAFRVGATDAPILAAELGLQTRRTLQETQNYHAWVRLMRNGTPQQARPMRTLAPPQPGKRLQKVIAFSRGRYMTDRALVEARIAAIFAAMPKSKPRTTRRRHPDEPQRPIKRLDR